MSEEERNGLIKQRRLLREKCKEKDKEIERLNKECDTYMKIATKKDNIINELEKWLKDEKEATIFDYHFAIEDILDKLQELKGSDNNG